MTRKDDLESLIEFQIVQPSHPIEAEIKIDKDLH